MTIIQNYFSILMHHDAWRLSIVPAKTSGPENLIDNCFANTLKNIFNNNSKF